MLDKIMHVLITAALFVALCASCPRRCSAECVEHRENPGSPYEGRHTTYCSPDDFIKRPALTTSIKFYRWNWEFNDMQLIKNSSQLHGKHLIILIHGFTGSAEVWKSTPHYNLIRGLRYARPRSDIMLVDWRTGAAPWGGDWNLLSLEDLYSKPARNTKAVGTVVARFLEIQPSAIDLSTTHCIGFSLGAHVCGFVGKALKHGRLGRITGLDPAGPGFDTPMSFDRLDSSDATFVDVVHSSQLGILRAIGHIDFYLNDPSGRQPSCEANSKKNGTINPSQHRQPPQQLLMNHHNSQQAGHHRQHWIARQKRAEIPNWLHHIFTNVITGIGVSNMDDLKSYFTGGAHRKPRNNQTSFGQATVNNVGRLAKGTYDEGSGNVCSHYSAIEAFAASCVSSCKIEFCTCLSYRATQHRDILTYQIRQNCTELHCDHIYKKATFGFYATPPVNDIGRYLYGNHKCQPLKDKTEVTTDAELLFKRSVIIDDKLTMTPICYVFTAETLALRYRHENGSVDESLILRTSENVRKNPAKFCLNDSGIYHALNLWSNDGRQQLIMFGNDGDDDDDFPTVSSSNTKECFRLCGQPPLAVIPELLSPENNGNKVKITPISEQVILVSVGLRVDVFHS